ncbi:MAG: hypothetical protein U0835_03980 [Isosphaeraceae bacterium]
MFFFILGIVTAVPPLRLDLPARPASALKGSEVARAVETLPLAAREKRFVAENEAGNVPESLRTLVPVRASDRVTFFAAPDYLAVGSDEDFFLVPLSPSTAQEVADRLGCALPTPRMVDDIYKQAALKLSPEPIPPSPAMTTVPVFLKHNDLVSAQRRAKGKDVAPGALVAGHKKDVVISARLRDRPGKVAIYGWHKPDGNPIQPLYTGHTAAWVDYSHGVRLVSRRVLVDGKPRTLDEVLADPELAPALSGEGVLRQTRYLAGPRPGAGETYEFLNLDPGVRVLISRPSEPTTKPLFLVFYGLPNGNTIEQTVGKVSKPGDDWHFDIQHVGAQTRFVREALPDREVVVAYLENDRKSWPAWRKQHGDAAVAPVLEAVKARFAGRKPRIVLSGHSGGGSLIFGYLNTLETFPDDVERVAFLDANYAYDTERHRDKFAAWLRGGTDRRLTVLAYDDFSARLNGKPFVSAEGGTWGRSRRMIADLEPMFPFQRSGKDGLERVEGLGGRLRFYMKENPERKILHTVQVERNGFIECLLSGTPAEGAGYTYMGERAYTRWVSAE